MVHRMIKTRILIVEDQTIVALDIQDRLTELGYEVTGVADRGDTALGAGGVHLSRCGAHGYQAEREHGRHRHRRSNS